MHFRRTVPIKNYAFPSQDLALSFGVSNPGAHSFADKLTFNSATDARMCSKSLAVGGEEEQLAERKGGSPCPHLSTQKHRSADSSPNLVLARPSD